MKNLEILDKWLFGASVAFLLVIGGFVYGIVVGKNQIAPYWTIESIYHAADSLLKFGKIVPENRLVESPADSSGERMFVQRPELMMKGYYAFVGWDDANGHYSAWLYNHRGQHLHTWTLDYDVLDRDGPLNGSEAPHPHGFAILRDGSIIVNFDRGDILARIDSCGQPVWTKQGVYHHSLQQAEDGSFWTWRGEGSYSSQYQYLENFDQETGDALREIGLVEDLIKNMGAQAAVFLVRPDFPFEHIDERPSDDKDIFHPNDIDVLYADVAPMFPEFEAGDLLISLLKPNLIAVVDPHDLVLKWWSHGPWRAQHDPDFTADGKISVYNNNTGMGRSEIIKIDPKSGEISNDLFEGEIRFYSAAMGKHQYLPNENVLIVVPGEGRILVASATGQKVMEFNNLSAKTTAYNAHVENGLWMPLDYFNKFPKCSH